MPRRRMIFYWHTGKPDECWPWLGKPNSEGYGQYNDNDRGTRKNYLAHRLVYEKLVGPIPGGQVLDHLCRNRMCVNPAHLEPVTIQENSRRGGRSSKPKEQAPDRLF